MVHIQTFGYIPSLLFYLGRYFFSTLRNNHGNVRLGVSVGSDTDHFLGGFHVGYEHNYALRGGWMLYWQAKCDLIVPDRQDLFRTGIVIGVKLPTK